MTNLSIGVDTFRVEVEGDAAKPALLLSHALGSDLSLWDAQMPAFLKAFRVIRYDTRGHGGSTADGDAFSIATLGCDVIGILDALEIETVHFVGISMGGAIGQWLLAHAAHRIERAVLANTTAKFSTPTSWNERIVGVLDKGMAAVADGTIERWFSPDFAEREPKKVAAIRALIEKSPPAGYAACCAALRDLDLRATLHAIAAPVLVVSGRDDQSIGDEATRHLVETIPGAKHIVLDARHISNVEADAAFTKAVMGFMTAKIRVKAKRPASEAGRVAPVRPTTITRRVGVRRSTAARVPLVGLTPAKTKAPASKNPASKTKTPDIKATDIKTPKLARQSKRGVAPGKARSISEAAKISFPKTKPVIGKTSKVETKPSGKILVAKTESRTTSSKTAASKTATTKTAATKATTKAAPTKTRVTPKVAAKPVTTKGVRAPAISKMTKASSSAKTIRRPSAKSLKAMAARPTPKAQAVKARTTRKPPAAVPQSSAKPKGKTAPAGAAKTAPTKPVTRKDAKAKASPPMAVAKATSASRTPTKASPKTKAGRRAS